MIYLASPYSHKNIFVMEERYRAAMDCAAWLLKDGKWVYSPIIHCHELAKRHELPKDFKFWMGYNKHMLLLASRMFVLALDGWDTSIGVTAEREIAKTYQLPTSLLEKREGGYEIKTLG